MTNMNTPSNENFITEEDVYLHTYNTRLQNLFAYISDLTSIDINHKVIMDNFSFWDYTIDAFNWEHMDYFLDTNSSWYEVFSEFKPEDLINESNIEILNHIMTWELRVAFIDNYEKILLLNKTIKTKTSENVAEILYLN